jgi:hypothetical protein
MKGCHLYRGPKGIPPHPLIPLRFRHIGRLVAPSGTQEELSAMSESTRSHIISERLEGNTRRGDATVTVARVEFRHIL